MKSTHRSNFFMCFSRTYFFDDFGLLSGLGFPDLGLEDFGLDDLEGFGLIA